MRSDCTIGFSSFLFIVALCGAKCPKTDDSSSAETSSSYGCVHDPSKVANIVAENDQWLKDPAIAKKLRDLAPAIATAWDAGYIEKSRNTLEPIGIIKAAHSGRDNVFELNGFEEFVIKMGRIDGNKQFAQARLDAQHLALKVIQDKGYNCLQIARATMVEAILSNRKIVYAEVEEKLDIQTDFSHIEKQYENFYAKFDDPIVGSKWVGGFGELFRQVGGFGCETGFNDYKFNNFPLVGSKGDKVAPVDLDYATPNNSNILENNQMGLYFFLNGTPIGRTHSVAIPHERFFKDIFAQMSHCITNRGGSFPAKLIYETNEDEVLVDDILEESAVQRFADARKERQTKLHEFERYLMAKNILPNSPADVLAALAVPNVHEGAVKYFLGGFNHYVAKLDASNILQTLAYARWFSGSYEKGANCEELKPSMDKLAAAGIIYDFECTGEQSYLLRA